ncbi:MAG: hypothetical protein ACYTGQ_19485 [Planctomycetota bacterium]
MTAWNVAEEGSFYLAEHDHLANGLYDRNVMQTVPAGDRVASRYPPGAALHAVPFYLVWPQEAVVDLIDPPSRPAPPVAVPIPGFGPAAIAASVTVALAMALLGLSLRRVVPGHVAVAGSYLMGLGTSAWSVAADALWQHGPAMLWIAAAGMLAAHSALRSGAAYAVAVVVRPPTVVIAFVTGLVASWRERSWRPAAKLGSMAAVGLVAIVLFNRWIFDEASISGGYDSGNRDGLFSLDIGWYLGNLRGALFDPSHGLLLYAPFLVPLAFGVRAAWRVAPVWVKGTAFGGLAYLLLVYKANRFGGGGGYATYRYPLEALMAAAPLIVLCFTEWVRSHPVALRVFTLGVAFAVIMQAAYAIGV